MALVLGSVETALFIRGSAPNSLEAFEATVDRVSDVFITADETIIQRMNSIVDITNAFESAILRQLKRIESQAKKSLGSEECRNILLKSILNNILSLRKGPMRLSTPSKYITINHLKTITQIIGCPTHITPFQHRIPNEISVSLQVSLLEDLKSSYLSGICDPHVSRKHIQDITFEDIPIDAFGRWVYSGVWNIPRKLESFTQPKNKVGGRGAGDQQFNRPFGIAISPITGNIYVADSKNGRIQVVSPDLHFLSRFGSCGSNEGQLKDPSGVGFSLDGSTLVVVDQGNHRIHLFSHDGHFIRTIGSKGNEPAQFNHPYFVVFDLDNNFYVSDSGNNRVQKFNLHGEFIQYIGCSNTTTARVGRVCGITINDANELLTISNPGSSVKVWSTDGALLRSFFVGMTTDMDNYLGRSVNGGFVLTDYGSNIITFCSARGDKLKQLFYPGPVGVGFDRQGRFFMPSWSESYLTVW